MKIVNRPRGGGKTTELIELMMRPGNEDVIYIAPTMQQASWAREMAMAAGMQPPTLNRFRKVPDNFGRHGGINRYVVDEADAVLSSLLGGKLVAIAGTFEVEE